MDNAENNQLILRQLEYYFSDSNLPRDTFLKRKISENDNGYVDLDVLLSFKKMMSLKATKSQIVNVVKQSKLLGCDTDGEKIRRITPLPKVSQFPNRAIFVSGWPSQATDPDCVEPVIDDIIKLFAPCGNVLDARLRRDRNRKFRGCLFVEMESAEAAERALSDEFEVEIKGKPVKLVTVAFLDYQEKIKKDPMTFGQQVFELEEELSKIKKRQWKDRDEKGRDKRRDSRGGGRHGDRDREDRADRNAGDGNTNNDEDGGNKRRKVEHTNGQANGAADKMDNTEAEKKPDDGEAKEKDGSAAKDSEKDMNGNARENGRDRNGDTGNGEIRYTPGVLLHIKGLSVGTSREDIGEVFEEFGQLQYVDFDRESLSGYIRFCSPEEVKTVAEKFEADKRPVNGTVPDVSMIDGDVEKAYWEKVHRLRVEKRKRNAERGGGRGGGRRGGGRGHRGRGRGRGGGGFRGGRGRDR